METILSLALGILMVCVVTWGGIRMHGDSKKALEETHLYDEAYSMLEKEEEEKEKSDESDLAD